VTHEGERGSSPPVKGGELCWSCGRRGQKVKDFVQHKARVTTYRCNKCDVSWKALRVDQWSKARKLVLARDCEKCLRCLGEATDVHHRKPKGMGGTSDPEVAFGLANLVSLCRECHNGIHGAPAQSYLSGYLVHSWDDPASTPLLVKPGSVYMWLRPDGSFERCGEIVLF
jgi:5-methylcytosine-specific restriction endonuclease McrA